MEIRYVEYGRLSEIQKQEIRRMEEAYLSNPDSDPEVDMYDWGAPKDGTFLLLDGERVVGFVSVHKAMSEYDGESFCLGGFGGLAVQEEYRGSGYGRALAECGLEKSAEIGVDIACMCVDMVSGIREFYEKLGFQLLNRPAYFTSWANKEKSDETVMIRGINRPELVETILRTKYKFHYGACKGHW